MADLTTDLPRVIGLRIARLRIARGESQEEVSLRSGLHRTAIGQLERGERVPRADTLIKVAGALEVDPGAMVAKLLWTPVTYKDGTFEVAPEDHEGAAGGGA